VHKNPLKLWYIGNKQRLFTNDCKKVLKYVQIVHQKTIINLSKELGMTTIAEGVETKEQYLVLKTLRCDIIQGFYFHKPMNEEEFLKIVPNVKS
jgi:EAL domain-containing protein (putative c-di-GMP-specific phosphodiesterase class I)